MPWSIHPLIHRRPQQRIAALAAVLVLVGGVACSAVGSAIQRTSESSVATEPGQPAVSGVAKPAAAPPAASPGANAAGGASAARAPATASDTAAQSSSASTSTSPLPDTSAQILDRMVIRTAQLNVEVPDMESALTQARAIASRAGGYVSASDTHVEKVGDEDRMVANLTLQVRSDAADSAISDLRALGKVTAENTGSQDVTDEYVDLDSNLRNLQASESAILKLMDRASQIQDVLSLQRELTNVRGQIERIQGRKTYLERRTDMATITLALRLPPPASSQIATGGAWNPIATALRGWQASLTVLRGVADVLIVVLAFSWWLVPLAAAGTYIVLHRRRTTQRPVAPEGA